MEFVWLWGGCVATPVQEMSLATAWAVLYSGLVECVTMWVLCFNCGMGCWLPANIGVPEALGGLYVGAV